MALDSDRSMDGVTSNNLSIPSIVPDDFDGSRGPSALIEQGHA
jgi:hypothetical protein